MCRLFFAAALFAALMVGLGACSTAGSERPASSTTQLAAADTDTLLASALSIYAETRDPAQALILVHRAGERAAKRPDVLWLQVLLCGQVAGCNAAPLETQLRKLDSGNGVAWLGALSRAQQQRDESAETQILAALSRSERINLYWNPLVWRIAKAMQAADLTVEKGIDDRLTRSLNTTVNQLSNLAVAALRPLSSACREHRLPDAVGHCSQIAQLLQRSDTYVAAGVGLGIEERLSSPTSAALSLSERVRIARYQQETAGQIMESQEDRAALSNELIELMRSLPREQDVFLAVLRWARQPTTPPPQWQPASN